MRLLLSRLLRGIWRRIQSGSKRTSLWHLGLGGMALGLFGKPRVEVYKAADASFAHMAQVASATYDQWISALIDTMAKGCDVDVGWAKRFIEVTDSRRDSYALYFAAVLAQEAQGIRVCLDERSGAAVRAALSHIMASKVEPIATSSPKKPKPSSETSMARSSNGRASLTGPGSRT